MPGPDWLVMKLRQKVFILVLIPIIGQFAFVGFLIMKQRQLEESAWKEQHFRTQTQELTNLSIFMYKGIGHLSVYGMSNQTSALKKFDDVYQKLQRKVELVSLLDRNNPSETSKRTKESFTRMMGSLYSARQMLEVKGSMAGGSSPILLVNDLQKEIEESLNNVERSIAERVKEASTDAQLTEKRRTEFQVGIISFFAVDMLFCSILFILFARDLARRFDIIVDNTTRISLGEALNKPVDGHDELTDLDNNIREMEIALRNAQARKEQLMNMVSHDLRGPLTTLQIVFELLLTNKAFELSEKTEKKLVDTDKVVKRLSRLVNDILDFDKLKIGKLDLTLDMVSIKSLLIESVEELQPLLDKEEIKVSIEGTDINVVADRERVPQIIINLLSNAVKFSPKKSQITIAISKHELEEEQSAISTEGDEKKFARISIRDSGPGVPELYRETIFLPFEQVPDDKRPKKGSTGLGLPICKMLVNIHGGDIGVEVPATGGSIFWFTLPIAESDEL
jgi:signal transduction histidine kinase